MESNTMSNIKLQIEALFPDRLNESQYRRDLMMAAIEKLEPHNKSRVFSAPAVIIEMTKGKEVKRLTSMPGSALAEMYYKFSPQYSGEGKNICFGDDWVKHTYNFEAQEWERNDPIYKS